MGYIFILLFFLIFNGFIVYISKHKFSECLPFTFILSSLIMFISVLLFNTFNIGFVINIIICISLIILLILKRNNNKIINDFKKNYFDIGLLAFIIIFILLVIYDHNKSLSMWDEYSHWGKMVKEMLRLDNLYSVSESNLLVHKDYPPIIPIYELLITKLFGKYQESLLITSIHLFEVSLFIPILSNITSKINKKNKILIILSIIPLVFELILLLDNYLIIHTIYIDYIMSLLIGYLLYLLYISDINNKYNLIGIILLSSFILLTKQVSIIFILPILIYYLIINKNIKLNKKLSLIIIPLVFFSIWNIYVKTNHINGQFSYSISSLNILGILTGSSGDAWQHEAMINFIKALFSKTITTSFIPLCYIQLVLLGILFLYIIHKKYNKYLNKNNFIKLIILIIILTLIYTLVMLIEYITTFGPDEGVNLASFDRYMDSYLLIEYSFILMLYLRVIFINNKINNLYVLIIILVLITNPYHLSRLLPTINKNTNEYENIANYLNNELSSNSKVYILTSSNSDAKDIYYINYYLNNISTQLPNELSNNNNIYNYDYIYTYDIDNEFINKYNYIFDNKLDNNKLYKIDNNHINYLK